MQNDFPLVCFVLWCYLVVLITTRVSPQNWFGFIYIQEGNTLSFCVFLCCCSHFLVVCAVIELIDIVLNLKSSDHCVNILYLGIKAEVNS